MKINNLGKRLLATTLLVTATVGMSAASYRSLVLGKTDGTTVILPLSQNLQTTITAEGNLAFSKDTELLMSVPMIQVDNWKFTEKSTTGLQGIAAANGYSVIGNLVVIDGLTASTSVKVISSAGQTVIETVAEHRCELSLENLPAGVYVIVYGNQTLKIAVR